jgi:uncharacterized protein YkwD
MILWVLPLIPAVFLASGSGEKTAEAVKSDPDLHIVEQQVLEQTNATRRRHGLAPLTLDRSLLKSARRHTSWMARRQTLRHTTSQVAENIAEGQRSARQALQDWMNSPGHRANILNPSYRRIGVAAYRASDGTCYWCQQFLR